MIMAFFMLCVLFFVFLLIIVAFVAGPTNLRKGFWRFKDGLFDLLDRIHDWASSLFQR